MTTHNLDDTDKEIIKLWKKGYSGSQIGKVVGITRNAVMGRVFRLRKAGVDVDSRTVEAVQKYEEVKKNYRKPRVALPKKEAEQQELTYGIPFQRLVSGACRYVINEGSAANYIFCGLPADMGAYCKHHYKLCYVPVERKKDRGQFNLKRVI